MAHATTDAAARAGGQIRTASAINLILGLWLILAAFMLAESEAASRNDLIVGIVVAALAAWRMSKPTDSTRPAGWLEALLGIWLIAAPFVLDYTADQERWNDVIVGILILAFGAWSASLPRRVDRVDRTTTTTRNP